jgi:hypothetical protein
MVKKVMEKDYISIKEASEKCGETKGCKKKVIGAVLTERK